MTDDGICAVCRCAEQGIGARRPQAKGLGDVVWTCDACLPVAKRIAHMKIDELNRLEREAIKAAGREAGGFLDGLNKTDLAQLSEADWLQFLAHVVDGFGNAMREQLKAGMAPF